MFIHFERLPPRHLHLQVLTLLRSMASWAQQCDLVCLNSVVAAAPWRSAVTMGSAERRCLDLPENPMEPWENGGLMGFNGI
jgi:hypothetical protein